MRVTTELRPGSPGHVQLVDEFHHDAQAAIKHDPDADLRATEEMRRELEQIGVRIPEILVSVSTRGDAGETINAKVAGFHAAIHLARDEGQTEGFFESDLLTLCESPRKFQFGRVRRGGRTYRVYVADRGEGWGAFEQESEGREFARELGGKCDRLPDATHIARQHITMHLPRSKAAAAIARNGR